MIIIDVIVSLILFFSFIGGIMQGAVKSFFSLVTLIIAIPLAGQYYPFFANLLRFLPGQNWENFFGFIIVLIIATIVLSFIFYFPRQLTEKSWSGGFFFRIIGGLLNLLGSSIGFVMLTLLISAYSVWDWLQQAMVNSVVISWLVSHLAFIQTLMPEIMRNTLPPTI
jgi:uncharacterized membrane protein required for colicin V production